MVKLLPVDRRNFCMHNIISSPNDSPSDITNCCWKRGNRKRKRKRKEGTKKRADNEQRNTERERGEQMQHTTLSSRCRARAEQKQRPHRGNAAPGGNQSQTQMLHLWQQTARVGYHKTADGCSAVAAVTRSYCLPFLAEIHRGGRLLHRCVVTVTPTTRQRQIKRRRQKGGSR